MRSSRLLPSLAAVLGFLATTSIAGATPMITGASGKGNGSVCSSCHGSNSPQPKFDVNLPDGVTANTTVDVTLKITGAPGQTYTSFDAQFDGDAIVTPGTGTAGGQGIGEVIASTPMAGQDGTYTFKVKVPNRNGTLTLWIAGLSANGKGKGSPAPGGTDDGDNAGVSIVTSTITGSDAGVTAPPDDPTGGTSTNSAATGEIDAGPPIIDPNPILPDGNPGCQSAPGRAPGLLGLAGVGGVVLALRRRRPKGRG